MTTPTALSAPAGRLLRAAGGRRALQLALLFGGLIALGLLCGGRAHADEASDALVPRTTTAVREKAVEPVREARPLHTARERASDEVRARAVEPVREHVARPVRRKVVDPVRTQVVRPVLKTVRQAAEPVGAAAGRVVEGVGEIATARPAPLPSGMPSLPGLPGLPGHSGTPAPTPGPVQPPASTGPQHADTPAAGHDRPSGARSKSAAASRSEAPVTAWWPGGAHHDEHRSGSARHAVTHPAAPTAPSRPDGPVANASAGDGGSTRHSDLHAAASDSRLPVLLPAGATASGRPAPVVDRHRDIPEFPG